MTYQYGYYGIPSITKSSNALYTEENPIFSELYQNGSIIDVMNINLYVSSWDSLCCYVKDVLFLIKIFNEGRALGPINYLKS